MKKPDYHIPVLLQESIAALSLVPNGIYLDLTFGGGGHSFAAGAKVNGKIIDVASKVVDKTIEIMKAQEKVKY